ncbi:hypothetical protein VTK73DRAFT_966 [Phialemonium thermophilum]|uniref:Uncharacterized protein n=1 Tax=Phialemonium thermophilum TaxID=223376 RepID=A0ABR3VU24_9PEZI
MRNISSTSAPLIPPVIIHFNAPDALANVVPLIDLRHALFRPSAKMSRHVLGRQNKEPHISCVADYGTWFADGLFQKVASCSPQPRRPMTVSYCVAPSRGPGQTR